jgi:hypothetical protein
MISSAPILLSWCPTDGEPDPNDPCYPCKPKAPIVIPWLWSSVITTLSSRDWTAGVIPPPVPPKTFQEFFVDEWMGWTHFKVGEHSEGWDTNSLGFGVSYSIYDTHTRLDDLGPLEGNKYQYPGYYDVPSTYTDTIIRHDTGTSTSTGTSFEPIQQSYKSGRTGKIYNSYSGALLDVQGLI